MAASCGNWTLLLKKQGISPLTLNAGFYQRMAFGICYLIIVKFKRRNNEDNRRQPHQWRGGASQAVTTTEDELQLPSESG